MIATSGNASGAGTRRHRPHTRTVSDRAAPGSHPDHPAQEHAGDPSARPRQPQPGPPTDEPWHAPPPCTEQHSQAAAHPHRNDPAQHPSDAPSHHHPIIMQSPTLSRRKTPIHPPPPPTRSAALLPHREPQTLTDDRTLPADTNSLPNPIRRTRPLVEEQVTAPTTQGPSRPRLPTISSSARHDATPIGRATPARR